MFATFGSKIEIATGMDTKGPKKIVKDYLQLLSSVNNPSIWRILQLSKFKDF